MILFNIIPTFIDIAIALVAFTVIFEWTLTLVIFVVMFAYGEKDSLLLFHMLIIVSVAASVILTRWRTRIRRQMNERDIVGLNSEHKAISLI